MEIDNNDIQMLEFSLLHTHTAADTRTACVHFTVSVTQL